MDTVQILLALIALIGVIAAPIITGCLNERQARRRERHAYIDTTVQALIEVRSKLQYLQFTSLDVMKYYGQIDITTDDAEKNRLRAELNAILANPEYRELEIYIGKAYAIMISVDDSAIRERAQTLLGLERLPEKIVEVIDFALEQLGKRYEFKL